MPAPADPAAPAAPPRAAIAFIFITIFLDLLGVGILIPVIPTIVRQFAPGGFVVGLLTLSYSAAQFLAAPALGAISDRTGRRPVLLISLVGSAVGYVIFGAAHSLTFLFVGRILDGITGGNISTAQAYLADVSRPADRSKNFGLVGVAFSLGFIIGPALGGVLSHAWGPSAPAYAAAALSLAAALFGWVALPESLPPERRHATAMHWRQFEPIGAMAGAFWMPVIAPLLVAWLFAQFAFASLQGNYAVYVLDRYGLGPSGSAGLFTLVGLIGVAMQGVVVRRLVHGGTERRWAITGLNWTALGFAAMALAPSVPWQYGAVAFYSVGAAFIMPTMTGLVSHQVDARTQGAILGVLHSGASLMRVVGPAYAGWVYDHLAWPAPYWTGAGMLVVAGVVVALRTGSGERGEGSGKSPGS